MLVGEVVLYFKFVTWASSDMPHDRQHTCATYIDTDEGRRFVRSNKRLFIEQPVVVPRYRSSHLSRVLQLSA